MMTEVAELKRQIEELKKEKQELIELDQKRVKTIEGLEENKGTLLDVVAKLGDDNMKLRDKYDELVTERTAATSLFNGLVALGAVLQGKKLKKPPIASPEPAQESNESEIK